MELFETAITTSLFAQKKTSVSSADVKARLVACTQTCQTDKNLITAWSRIATAT